MQKYLDEIELAVKIRVFEEKLITLYEKGLLHGTIHTCVGQELIGVFVEKHIQKDDYFFSNHRGHGHYISKTGDIKGLISEIMGKENGVCHGYGGSQHLHNTGFFSNGIQGSMVSVGAGYAFSNKLMGKKNISIVFIGDGTLGEGEIYETFNIVAKWDIPILFVLENNGYAQSTSQKQTFSGDLQKRIEGFGLQYLKTNIWDLEDLDMIIKKGVDAARLNNPTFIEIECYRLNPHSKGDDNRDYKEILSFWQKDIISLFKKDNPELYNKYYQTAIDVVEEAYNNTLNEKDLLNPVITINNYNNSVIFNKYINEIDDKQRVNEIIFESLKSIFESDSSTIMIGEDIENNNKYNPKPYGGAFKVSRKLSSLFPNRILNTPISEAAITGISIGLALNKHKAFLEIMFGDFISLSFNQILQNASKIVTMFGENIELPLFIRTPMGGRRGYGPTHSQSIEKYFLGIPNLNIIALNHIVSPKIIYKNLVEFEKKPTLIIENKVLYTRKLGGKGMPGFEYYLSEERYPTLKISPCVSEIDYTIFCYGGILEEVENAINILLDDEIFCEVICPSLICPININPIIKSVMKTKKIVVIEEGTKFAALGSEIIALLNENNLNLTTVKRISNDSIIPCSYNAETNLLPTCNNIVETLKNI